MNNVMQWEKLLPPFINKLHPTLLPARLGSKFISEGALSSVSAK